MDVCRLPSPSPLQPAGVTYVYVETDNVSPIGLNLTQPHNENNRPLVTQTTPLNRLRREDLAFWKLAIFPEIQVSS